MQTFTSIDFLLVAMGRLRRKMTTKQDSHEKQRANINCMKTEGMVISKTVDPRNQNHINAEVLFCSGAFAVYLEILDKFQKKNLQCHQS